MLLALILFFSGSAAIAQSKTLIVMKAGKAAPGLAKSWKKLAEGKYHFDLDPKAEVAKGKVVTPLHVKASLESSLGTVLSVKVTPQGATAVEVSYSGEEEKFLKRLAKTKITGQDGVKIALGSGVSDGGIRAKVAARGPAADEVKAKYIKAEGAAGNHMVLVVEKGAAVADDVKGGQTLKVHAADAVSLQKGQVFFFKPAAAPVDGIWSISAISDK